jgi:subtilisin family serine protease
MKPAYPTLDSYLNDVVSALATGATPRDASGSALTNATVPVRIELATQDDTSAVVAYLLEHGAGQIGARGTVVQASVSPDVLVALSEQPGVVAVRSSVPPVAGVVSQGASIHGAPAWNSSGYLGTGVKVGVIDVGFIGLSAWMGTELPVDIVGLCFRLIGLSTGDLADCELRDRHGVAVAETIVDVAPGVDLYISNPQTPYDLNVAVEWMIAQGVTVINHSVGWGYEGPGDGTSRFSDSALLAVDTAVAAGVTWVNSAGNEGLSTWTGAWSDIDGDGELEFGPGDERNSVILTGGKVAVIQMRWDDAWDAAGSDVDLFLYDSGGNIVRSSTDLQNGQSGQDPYEWFAFTPPASGTYWIGVDLLGGTEPAWAQVQAFTGEALAYHVASSSIGNPAESANPGMLAVGATYWGSLTAIEPFSSNGPTRDGRIKPDIVAVDGGDTASNGAFYGTSQAAPHVAGMVALVRQRFPDKSPADITSYLRFHATPVGLESPNNAWGAGLALLPAVAPSDNPFPSARTLSPSTAAVGGNEVTLTVTGEDFVESSVVRWNGSDRPTIAVDATTLRARISAADLASPGISLVTVFTPGPGGGVSTPLAFSIASEHPDFDAPEFRNTWGRTDDPVAQGATTRTWMWGPDPFTDGLFEEYAQGPDGERFVQYFDKSRMEISAEPGIDPNSIWYITNGLLSLELITGRMQLGDATFEQHLPAIVNVAGDPDDTAGPTYATFTNLLGAAPAEDGAPLTQRIARNGTLTDDPSLAVYGAYAAHRVQVPGIDHQVASVFWDFANSQGLVAQSGEFVVDLLFINPFYATGYPITEAYWATVKVAGEYVDVLMQCFERRCLTYTPGNPEGWEVEAGNVGQHYFHWRYVDVPIEGFGFE